MSSSAHKLPITAAEYLEGELRSEVRHEFVDGRIYAMSGASRKHSKTIIRLESIGYAAPLATFYQSNPFPEDVKRPWYHLNRIED